MRTPLFYILTLIILHIMSGCNQEEKLSAEIFETSESGHQLTQIEEENLTEFDAEITITKDKRYQTITGFGGSFTESSAYLLNNLSKENRDQVLQAYFGEEGARYSLTRTHINSCDFSLTNYSYAPTPNDLQLDSFSIHEDKDDIIPMIKDAMAISKDGFKIISSPWTAPPWMKDNTDWKGGKLLPEYYDTWALFFSKYISEYQKEGIDIWGVTVENEPLGNDNNWESMHYSPEEMTFFVQNYLGPKLKEDDHDVKILGYDQNRNEELIHWADVMYKDDQTSKYYDGCAVHWYASTYDFFPDALQYVHNKAPQKYLIQTEACIDAEVPKWKNDEWYWSKEATDWGFDWAPEEQKYLHPKYAPVNRYAQDIIGCLNNWVDGWVDWNMVLDKQGGPNWANNWCTAPVIVDPENDEVYFTPLYYVMAHFSRFIRPEAVRIGHTCSTEDLNIASVENPDGSIAIVLFNPNEVEKSVKLSIDNKSISFKVSNKAIQTIIIN